VIAATSVEHDGRGRTVLEGAVGLDVISDGRTSPSSLVRAVAVALVERVGDPEAGGQAPAMEFPDPHAGIADVLDRARQATALLAVRVPEPDAAAYRHWLVEVAEAVVSAAKSGDVLGFGGEWVSGPERQFVSDLTAALSD
jgi:hypothetical protein